MAYDLYIGTAEARALQKKLSAEIILRDELGEVRRVAGTDCAFKDGGRLTRAVVAVLSFPGLELIEHSVAERPTDFPYIPGLLSFREVPTLLEAFAGLRQAPDLLLCDGQGYAHPRRFGIACHLGLATGIPSIGVAKSRLIGTHREPAEAAGSQMPLIDKGETIGTVLRTKDGINPLYISSGHRVSPVTAVDWVLACCRGYRLPETTRWADGLAGDPAFKLKARRIR
ncbi:MAG TPA: deoxyribonuclease V [Gammaproteobacteria bacterium]|jgi:deoxyribonuclease V|nr:deoxyribonuclease V [Gammaproteobacteria bacterium]